MATPALRGYGGVAKSLHWLVFALVFAQYVVAVSMPDIGRGTVPGTLINLHMSIGATILLVIVLRWLWRVRHPVPLSTVGPSWETDVARITHALLYVLLVVDPVLGWMNASARDWKITIYGIVTLPHVVAPRARIGMVAGDVHTFLAWTLLVLIVAHVAAALYHFLLRRDGVLERMLPGVGD